MELLPFAKNKYLHCARIKRLVILYIIHKAKLFSASDLICTVGILSCVTFFFISGNSIRNVQFKITKNLNYSISFQTANVLTFVLYQLAQNMECQEKIFKEIQNASVCMANDDTKPFQNLQYLKACVKESMR